MKNKKVIVGAIIIAVLGIATVIYTTQNTQGEESQETVEQTIALEWVTTDITLELGSTTITPEALLVDATIVDLEDIIISDTEVDYNAVGAYTLTATYEEEVHEFALIIEDTTAPDITFVGETTIYMKVGDTLNLGEIMAATDLSDSTITCDLTAGYDADSQVFAFGEVGTSVTVLTAADCYANQSTRIVTFVIGDNPTIEGMEDKTIEEGDALDVLTGVTATDYEGEDLTDAIIVDTSAVDTATKGTYEVIYQVEDSNGYEAIESTNVIVEEKEVVVVTPSTTTTTSTATDTSKEEDKAEAETEVEVEDKTEAETEVEDKVEVEDKAETEDKVEAEAEAEEEAEVEVKEKYAYLVEEYPDIAADRLYIIHNHDVYIDEDNSIWREFTSRSEMSDEDTAACDAIAQSYFFGEITMEECKEALLVYQAKYMAEGIETCGMGIAGNGEEYQREILSTYIRIYRASQDCYTDDDRIIEYSIQF